MNRAEIAALLREIAKGCEDYPGCVMCVMGHAVGEHDEDCPLARALAELEGEEAPAKCRRCGCELPSACHECMEAEIDEGFREAAARRSGSVKATLKARRADPPPLYPDDDGVTSVDCRGEPIFTGAQLHAEAARLRAALVEALEIADTAASYVADGLGKRRALNRIAALRQVAGEGGE